MAKKTNDGNAVAAPFLRHHVHSVHSARDGMLKIADLVREAKESGELFSLTDHGTVSGWIECLAECKAQGVKPVLGIEAYVNNHRDRLLELSRGAIDAEKDPAAKRALQEERDSKKRNFHLVLIARNQHGLMNLLELSNKGFVEGFYGRPLVTYADVVGMSDGPDGTPGVIVTSACMGGTIGSRILEAKEKKDKTALLEAEEFARAMAERFGGDFYLEVQSNGIPEQRTINKGLLAMARRTGIKVCVGMDSHYLKADWADTHQDLLLLQDKKTKDDVGKFDVRITVENAQGERKTRRMQGETEFRKGHRADQVKVGDEFGKGKAKDTVVEVNMVPRVWSFSTDKVWYKSEKELKAETRKLHPELAEHMDEICGVNREIGAKVEQVGLDSAIKLPASGDADRQLIQAVKDGLRARRLVRRDYLERAKEELERIRENGFCEYFLILADIMKFARQRNIPIGAARGSATGSLVAYVLGIHRVDPLDPRWGSPLPFERFLSASRRAMKVIVEGDGDRLEFLELDEVEVSRSGKTFVVKAIDLKEGDEIVSIKKSVER